MSDRPVTKVATYKTPNKHKKQPCPQRDSNPLSQQSIGRTYALDHTATEIGKQNTILLKPLFVSSQEMKLWNQKTRLHKTYPLSSSPAQNPEVQNPFHKGYTHNKQFRPIKVTFSHAQCMCGPIPIYTGTYPVAWPTRFSTENVCVRN